MLCVKDRFLAYRDRHTIALSKHIEDQAIGKALRYPQSGSDGSSFLPELASLRSSVRGTHNRRAALCLDSHHSRAVSALQPAELLKLVEGFPHTDQAGSTSC